MAENRGHRTGWFRYCPPSTYPEVAVPRRHYASYGPAPAVSPRRATSAPRSPTSGDWSAGASRRSWERHGRASGRCSRATLAEHLGHDAGELEVVEETWPGYDHVNVQAGLDAWLADPDARGSSSASPASST